MTRMMLCAVLLLGWGAEMGWALEPGDAHRVLVVYRSNFTGDSDANGVQDSWQIAQHYANFRGIPTNNLLGLVLSNNYGSTHAEFYNQIVRPLRSKLYSVGETNIDVLLLIYGIPISTPGYLGTICVDNCLMNIHNIPGTVNASYGNYYYRPNPYFEANPTFGSDRGHFSHDAFDDYATGSNIYMVCRLDPRDPAGAPWLTISQLEQMRYAEKYISTNQSMGVSYVDSRYAYYTDAQLSNDASVLSGSYSDYDAADKNIAYAEHYISAKGLPLGWERSTTVIGRTGAEIARATNAWMHGGWYHGAWGAGYGYTDAYDWLPGSASCDLNSDSAIYIYYEQHWLEQAFKRGLSVGCGVIGEAYLYGHPRPNVFLYYLLQGYTFAEAATLATSAVFWLSTNLGDPLYAPFRPKAVTPDTTTPVVATGFPFVSQTNLTSATVVFQLNISTTEPEVARCVLHYGVTPDCTQSNASLQGYWVRNNFSITGLLSSTVYYYYVTLTDLAGHTTNSSVKSFRTSNTAPVADFVANAWTGRAPFAVTFDGTISTDIDGSVSQWFWTFGDGATGTGAVVEHTFTNLGISTVTLRVMDDQGAGATNRHTVWVDPSSGCMAMLQYGLQSYTNTRDAHISCYSGETALNFGGASAAITYSSVRRALVRFDLPALPPGAVIDSAELRLTMAWKGYGNASDPWGLYRLTNDWVEGSGAGAGSGVGAIWADYDRGHPWATPGGDYDPTPLATINYGSLGSCTIFDVKNVVLNWKNGVYPNYGFLLKVMSGSAEIDFYTREYGDSTKRPQLLIFYHVPEPEGLTVTPSNLSFNAIYNATAADQSFLISNQCDFALAYTSAVEYGVGATNWFQCETLAGSLDVGVVQFHTGRVNLAGLNAGSYQAACTLTSSTMAIPPAVLTLALTVQRAGQTISFSALPDQIATNAPGLSATASSGLPVSFSLLSGPALLSQGTNLSFTGSGLVTLTASQSGNSNWLGAATLTNSFNVSKAAAVVMLTNLFAAYDGLPKNVSASTVPGGLSVRVTYDGATNPPVNSGSYSVTGEVVSALYQGEEIGSLMIAQAAQTISNFLPTNGTALVETNRVVLSGLASSGQPVSFVVHSGPAVISDGTNLSFTAHGVVYVVCTQAGDANHLAAPAVTNAYRSWGLFTLTVESAHGAGDPAPGVYVYVEGTGVTNRMEAFDTQGATQFVAAGWSLAGHQPSEAGGSTSLVLMLTNDAILSWLWTTNYWLDTEAGPHGSVDAVDGWRACGSSVAITATPEMYYHFDGWSGSDSSSVNPLWLSLDAPKSVAARFAENRTTNTCTPEPWLAAHGFTNEFETAAQDDADGDGVSTADEYTADTDPTQRDSCLHLTLDGAGFVSWVGGTQAIQHLEYCTDLSSNEWETLATHEPPTARTNRAPVTAVDVHSFYRIRVLRP